MWVMSFASISMKYLPQIFLIKNVVSLLVFFVVQTESILFDRFFFDLEFDDHIFLHDQ